jgi:hypothetical protein
VLSAEITGFNTFQTEPSFRTGAPPDSGVPDNTLNDWLQNEQYRDVLIEQPTIDVNDGQITYADNSVAQDVGYTNFLGTYSQGRGAITVDTQKISQDGHSATFTVVGKFAVNIFDNTMRAIGHIGGWGTGAHRLAYMWQKNVYTLGCDGSHQLRASNSIPN